MKGDIEYKCILVAALATIAMPIAWAKLSDGRLPGKAAIEPSSVFSKTVTTTTVTTTHSNEPELTKDEWNRAIAQLRQMHLRVPIDQFNPEKMKGSFYEERGGQRHEAVDMLAPRNTPIHAISDGTIAKLFNSRFGGTTIYQFDPQQHFIFYYAHLEKYAADLKEKQSVRRGDVIGYVGTSGNAPPDTPHLHLSISVLGKDNHWWETVPVDPYEIYRVQ